MNILELQPLLAAADVWEIVVGALFFIIWTVGQLLGNRKEAKQQKKPRRPRPPQPVEVAQRGPQGVARLGPPRKQEDALRSEVEDFLRRAQGQPAKKPDNKPGWQQPIPAERQQKKSPRSTLVSSAQQTEVSRAQQTEVSRAQQTEVSRAQQTEVSRAQQTEVSRAQRTAASKGPARRPAGPQQVSAEGQNLRQEGVAEHVAKHLSTQDIVAQSSALGETVGLADERLETRLHAKFDHDLGRLSHRETPTDSTPQAKAMTGADIATEIAAMLSEPQGMRKLIVANAILNRPEW